MQKSYSDIPNQLETIDGRIQVHKQIGDGFFSKVYLVSELSQLAKSSTEVGYSELQSTADTGIVTNKQFALKTFEKKEFKKLGVKEFQFLKQHGSHPQIIKVHDYYSSSIHCKIASPGSDQKVMTKGFDYMTMEYCENGDLFNLIKNNGKLPDNLARNLFSQMLDAVEYLHQTAKVAHLDLKLENILINSDFKLKLCDFGFVKSLKNKAKKNVGTDGYKAPEIYTQSKIEGYEGDKADIFALGVLLFIMIFGVPPFTMATQDNSLYKVFFKDRKYICYFFKWHPITKNLYLNGLLDVNLIDLLIALMDEDPQKRPQSIREIRNFTYLQGETLSSEASQTELKRLLEGIKNKDQTL